MFGWILRCSLIVWLIHCTDGQCTRDVNGDYLFGPNCDFICHCLNKEQCDRATGECASGCDWEWAGQGCQSKNIALGELSRHLDNMPKYRFSDLANDKNLNTCSETDYENSTRNVNPWWKIWFPQNETFKQLTIRTNTDKKAYFSNFKVTAEYVPAENNTEKTFYPENPQICYEQRDRASESIIINVICNKPVVGNQLRIQLGSINTQLVICDIRIFRECDDGTYGKSCGNKCSGNCNKDDVCVKSSGSCPNGCKPGYKTDTCDQKCEDGTYGKSCRGTCSGNCLNEEICDKSNGSCPRGCKPGYKEDKCDKMCPDGYYGMYCIQKCSEHCIGVCDKIEGRCAQCEHGLKGVYCTNECEDGTYGKNCGDTCSGNCLKEDICVKSNGSCPRGCKPGYNEDKCDKMCPDGYYGMYCFQECNEHCIDVCDKIDGTCPRCEHGWKGVNCTEECDNGSYGENCNNACGHCKYGSPCHKTNGTCTLGCAEGFTGHGCIKGASLTKTLIGVVVGVGIAWLCLTAAVVHLVVKNRRVSYNQGNPQVQRTTSDRNQSIYTDLQGQEVVYINCETDYDALENVNCQLESNPTVGQGCKLQEEMKLHRF